MGRIAFGGRMMYCNSSYIWFTKQQKIKRKGAKAQRAARNIFRPALSMLKVTRRLATILQESKLAEYSIGYNSLEERLRVA